MTEPAQTTRRWQLPIAAVLSFIGLGVSLYLTRHHLTSLQSGAPSACNFGGAWNCDLVSAGEYSTLWGIPLSHVGSLFYLLTALLSLLGAVRSSIRKPLHGLLVVLSLFAVLLSVGLFSLSTVVIRAFCLFCLILHATNVGLLLTMLLGGRTAVRSLRALSPGQLLRNPALLLIVIGGLFGALSSMLGIRYVLDSQRTANRLAAELVAKQAVKVDPKPGTPSLDIPSAPSLGPKDAPITLVEVSDFECPFCQKVSGVVEELLVQYPGKIRVVFRHFPLDEECNPLVKRKIHEHACAAARSAYCAGRQGKFFPMAKKLFGGAVDDPDPKPLAQELGLDVETFARCLLSPEARSTILDDIQAASQHGVRGVPVIFLNGRPVKGAQPIETYRQIISEELTKSAK
ncbi:MAG: thioredoxin domain-containing protein [Myxococcales bacterium]|nr:thioredoxin domain-containing protein [Myxococcales bacterium]